MPTNPAATTNAIEQSPRDREHSDALRPERALQGDPERDAEQHPEHGAVDRDHHGLEPDHAPQLLARRPDGSQQADLAGPLDDD